MVDFNDFKGETTNKNFHWKIKKTKKKSQIFKNVSDGVKRFEFEGGRIKLTRTVNILKFNHFFF